MVILKQDRIEYTNVVIDRNIFACVGYFISFYGFVKYQACYVSKI